METRMMKLVKGLMWSMGIVLAASIVFAITRAFDSSFLDQYDRVEIKEDYDMAMGYERMAHDENAPKKELRYWGRSAALYAKARDNAHPGTLEHAKSMVPRMQELVQKHGAPKIEPEYELIFMVHHAKRDFSCLAAHIHSGVYDFSAQSKQDSRLEASRLLTKILAILNDERYGDTAEQLKPIVVSLLQQGARTTWPDIADVCALLCQNPDTQDSVLIAVRTRDADFLRAVLDCGLSPHGINGNNKPGFEAEWQNSPDLVEILRSYNR